MADPPDKNYPLHDAVLRADAEEVARLLKAGADPNAADSSGMTPLIWAVYGGYAEIAELLCEAGADVERRASTGGTALWHAEDDFGLEGVALVLRRFGAGTK